MNAIRAEAGKYASKFLGQWTYDLRVRLAAGSGDGRPVLIWQMGKVGSMTVDTTLRKSSLDAPIFHVHELSDELLRSSELYRRDLQNHTRTYMRNLAIRTELERARTGWRVISLVRDPLARNVSAFFQNLDVYIGRKSRRILEDHADPVGLLHATFVHEYDHERPVRWFDHEMKGVLGVDVFRDGFNKEAGTSSYISGEHRILVLRMEDLQRVLPTSLEQFLGIQSVSVLSANTGEAKWYAPYYHQLKAQARIPKSLIDETYDSVYARTFYSDDELAIMRSRWMPA